MSVINSGGDSSADVEKWGKLSVMFKVTGQNSKAAFHLDLKHYWTEYCWLAALPCLAFESQFLYLNSS